MSELRKQGRREHREPERLPFAVFKLAWFSLGGSSNAVWKGLLQYPATVPSVWGSLAVSGEPEAAEGWGRRIKLGSAPPPPS